MINADEDSLNIEMVEGDYGIVLPIIIKNEAITSVDKFSIKIFKEVNTEAIIEKEYRNIKENTINFMLTKEDSNKLKPGKYLYDLDWFQNDVFLSNILRKKKFTVQEKAGG